METTLKLKITPFLEYLGLTIYLIKPSAGFSFLIKSRETIPLKFGKDKIHKSGLLKLPACYILLAIFILTRISGLTWYPDRNMSIRLAGYPAKPVSGASKFEPECFQHIL
jgi:hypothetical protein